MSRQQPTQVVVQSSQAVPAVVNLFFPPFGQLVQGRVGAFFVWLVVLIAAGLSILAFGIGIVLLPLAWIVCIVDAAKYRPRVR